jgi:hypothetical protein
MPHVCVMLRIGMLSFFLPVSILAGILASLNLITLTWNEQTITGLGRSSPRR